MTHLAAHALTISLGQRAVLRSLDFKAGAGELVCVLGPNGAGKSTLLRALAGFFPQAPVTWDGVPLSQIPARQRACTIAWLSQDGDAVWPLPVRGIVALGRIPHGATLDSLTAQDRDAIDRALHACDLQSLADRDITTLSGGERARAFAARALAVEAPVLLADEPVSALDPHHQLTVMGSLHRAAQEGHLVIAVLHDLTLAARFANRIVLMKDGGIIAQGKPDRVLTPDLLRAVFAVDVVSVDHDGTRIVLPWSARND